MTAPDAVPRTLPQLLRHLGVADEPVTRQQVVIASWLAEHRPTAQLRLSIRMNGYGLLLGPVGTRRGPVQAQAPSAGADPLGDKHFGG